MSLPPNGRHGRVVSEDGAEGTDSVERLRAAGGAQATQQVLQVAAVVLDHETVQQLGDGAPPLAGGQPVHQTQTQVQRQLRVRVRRQEHDGQQEVVAELHVRVLQQETQTLSVASPDKDFMLIHSNNSI